MESFIYITSIVYRPSFAEAVSTVNRSPFSHKLDLFAKEEASIALLIWNRKRCSRRSLRRSNCVFFQVPASRGNQGVYYVFGQSPRMPPLVLTESLPDLRSTGNSMEIEALFTDRSIRDAAIQRMRSTNLNRIRFYGKPNDG